MNQPRKHTPVSKAELIARLRANAGPGAQPVAERQTLTLAAPAPTLPSPSRPVAARHNAPPALQAVRRSSWTGPKQRLFIRTLAATGSVEQSAVRVGMSVSSAYRLRLRPDALAFRSAWTRALRSCVNSVRDVAYDRAINGEQKLIVRNGEVKGRYQAFNDRMIMFMLRSYDNRFKMLCDADVETQLIDDLEALRDLPDEVEEVIAFDDPASQMLDA